MGSCGSQKKKIESIINSNYFVIIKNFNLRAKSQNSSRRNEKTM